MSEENEVEQLLENFEKALETLKRLENVESMVSKLDASKTRKLLKKVKHVVTQAHRKVEIVKEKVGKVCKKVRLNSDTENEEGESSSKEVDATPQSSQANNATESQENTDNSEKESNENEINKKAVKSTKTKKKSKIKQSKVVESESDDEDSKRDDKDSEPEDKDSDPEECISEDKDQTNAGKKSKKKTSLLEETQSDISECIEATPPPPPNKSLKMTISMSKSLNNLVSELHNQDTDEERDDEQSEVGDKTDNPNGTDNNQGIGKSLNNLVSDEDSLERDEVIDDEQSELSISTDKTKDNLNGTGDNEGMSTELEKKGKKKNSDVIEVIPSDKDDDKVKESNVDNGKDSDVEAEKSKESDNIKGTCDKNGDDATEAMQVNENVESDAIEKPDSTEESPAKVKPMIKLVDISKLMAPKPKKSVSFDCSIIILSSSDEDRPKKSVKPNKPLKSALKSPTKLECASDDSDHGSRLRNRTKNKEKRKQKETPETEVIEDSSDSESKTRSSRSKKLSSNNKAKFSSFVTERNKRRLGRSSSNNKDDDKEKEDQSDSDSDEADKKKSRRLRSDKSKKSLRSTRTKEKNTSDSSEDSDSDAKEKEARARRKNNTEDKSMKKQSKIARKKELLEESSLSEESTDDSGESDTMESKKSRKRPMPKSESLKESNRRTLRKIDKNDIKFRSEVYIGLPLFKCEDLPDIYERKKELFEIKRTRRNPSKDEDKPEKKRIKLTLKLNRNAEQEKEKEAEKSLDGSEKDTDKSDQESESANINLNKSDDASGDGSQNVGLENSDPLLDSSEVVSERSENILAVAGLAQDCLDNIDESDKEDIEKNGSSVEEEENRAKDKSPDKNKDSDDGETDKVESPKENGKLSDEEKDLSDEAAKSEKEEDSEDELTKGKKSKEWKKDKLLKDKIDTSESDDDFAKVTKKKKDSAGKSKKRKKKTVISDSGSEYDDKGSEKSESEKSSRSESEHETDEEEKKKKKPNRKRIKRKTNSSSSDDEDKSTRKQIRKVIDRDSLSETTKKAEEEEKERKSRIAEKQKKYNQIFQMKENVVVEEVVLDFDEKKNKPLLSVDKTLAKQLKPHQVNGVKFMFDACFESLERARKTGGSGCILAHCMGLGKTLQVITLIHTLLTNCEETKVNRVMVVCPVNTVLNWKSEFKKWMPDEDDFEVYDLVSLKTSAINSDRSYIVNLWRENGGVLIIGYNMFRTISNPDNKGIPKKFKKTFHDGLVDPGPDLVICDEGHLLKNEKTNLSIAMNRIRTARRIVLTGTPLQNNLKEYWCMVQFIKPNLLGTYKEYLNRFVNPITNGQYTDSTQHDIVIMRKRSHVLHKLLDGVVQRQDYAVLAPYLPPKHEYVLFVKLTEVQTKLYKYYMENFGRKMDGSSKMSFLFQDFQQLQRICTHPKILMEKSNEDKEKFLDDSESEGSIKDFIVDRSEDEATSSDSRSSGSEDSDVSLRSDKEESKHVPKRSSKRKRVTRAQAAQKKANEQQSEESEDEQEPKQWWEEFIPKDQMDNLNHSAKIFLLFQILQECEEIGDKILVFSQSLYTLNCIEYFLRRIDEATQKGETDLVGGHSGSWTIGLDYFRLDGSSSCDNRAIWCDYFNNPDNTRARLFLISTKAGGLGINLVAANRVIIFDVSWNPSHDIQSIYRVYRFGQTKPCYIYRFVSYGTMEMKIYERQVTKQAISKRVIDEQQIDRHYSQHDVQELYKTDLEPKDRPIPLVPKDVLLGEMLHKYEHTIFKYHEHQSLLENKEEEGLNEEERKAAWEEFENEKVLRQNTAKSAFAGLNLAAFQNNAIPSPQSIHAALANIIRKDNPTWSAVQIKGILPALVQQLQLQMSEGNFTMYQRVQNEIRMMQVLQARRENYLKVQQDMVRKQQLTNQMLGNLNVTPEELRRLQAMTQGAQPQGNFSGGYAHMQNQILNQLLAGSSAAAPQQGPPEIIELND